MASFGIPAGLREGTNYAIDDQIKKGYMRDVTGTNLYPYWITTGFPIDKKRLVAGTQVKAIRLIGAFQMLNAATMPLPSHHRCLCPDVTQIGYDIPLGTHLHKLYDVSDAYHTCKCTKSTTMLLVVDFGGRLVQYLTGAQGVSQMAQFWHVHITDGFYYFFNKFWEDWWAGYVDEFNVFANDPTRAAIRDRIFVEFMRTMNKPFSCVTTADTSISTCKSSDPTIDPLTIPFGPSVVLAGLHIDIDGIRVEDAAIDVLKYTLTDYIPKIKNIHNMPLV
jgi:hypothetical protein